jgi:hypothetical protein
MINIEEVKSIYNEGCGVKEIGFYFNIPTTTMMRIFKRNGIKRREKGWNLFSRRTNEAQDRFYTRFGFYLDEGYNLKTLLKAHNNNKSEIARMCNVSRKLISKWARRVR